MEIDICGCGWTGSLLSAILSREGHHVEVYERRKQLHSVCGCAMSYTGLEDVCYSIDLNPEKYLHRMIHRVTVSYDELVVTGEVGNLCTFNKLELMKDAVEKSEALYHFGEPFKNEEDKDLLVDASGVRALLGRHPADNIIPAYQVEAEFKDPIERIYIQFLNPLEKGYRWVIPIDKHKAYVGCGTQNDGQLAYSKTHEYLRDAGGKVLSDDGKSIRLTRLENSNPVYREDLLRNPVVGVGESIGAIGAGGGGNEASWRSVKLLAEHINNPETYQEKLLEALSYERTTWDLFDAYTCRDRIKAMKYLKRMAENGRKRYKVSTPLIEVFRFFYQIIKREIGV